MENSLKWTLLTEQSSITEGKSVYNYQAAPCPPTYFLLFRLGEWRKEAGVGVHVSGLALMRLRRWLMDVLTEIEDFLPGALEEEELLAFADVLVVDDRVSDGTQLTSATKFAFHHHVFRIGSKSPFLN